MDNIKKYINILAILLIILSPAVYYIFKDKTLTIFTVISLLIVYVLTSNYLISRIKIYDLVIDLETSLEEISVTKEQFDLAIGKLLEKEYYNLSNSTYVVPLEIAEKEILPILDSLREATNNEDNIKLIKNRNKIIYSKLTSVVWSIKKEIKNSTDNTDNDQAFVLLNKYDRDNIIDLTPIKLEGVLRAYFSNNEIKLLYDQYNNIFSEIEMV